MAKWGKCDFKQLERLNKNMEKLMGADLDRFCRQAAQELAGRLLNKVVKRTPVVYGTLRDAWAVMPVGHRGTHYTVVVLNNLQYRNFNDHGRLLRLRRLYHAIFFGGAKCIGSSKTGPTLA